MKPVLQRFALGDSTLSMPRTPFSRLITKLYRDSHGSRLSEIPVSEFVEHKAAQGRSRREFLGQSGRALIAAAGTAAFGDGWISAAKSSPAIAVVGAGLGGLTCAWRLRQAGVNATVYEANDRLGGRCYSRRGYFADQQIVERGGELIDTDHTAVQDLAAEFGLVLDDLIASEPAHTEPFYRFGGRKYSYVQILERFQAIYPRLQSDLEAVGDIDYTGGSRRGLHLDHTSLAEYIERLTNESGDEVLPSLLNVAYTIEFGAATDDQSSINLLYLLSYSPSDSFDIFGGSDERYHIRGGNDQLVSHLAHRLGSAVVSSSPMVAISKRTDGRYSLAFESGSPKRTVVADHVVLALPFSILRCSVDHSKAGFSPLKQLAIQTLGMGNNAKLHLQFRRRIWNRLGNNGDTFADTGYQNTWEVTRAQAGNSGILVDYLGGQPAVHSGKFHFPSVVQSALRQIEPVLPGLSAQFNGVAALEYWPGNPWSRGAYSYWKVGQYSSIAGSEGIREGNVHFCGEHTSYDYQGYLNGAVDSGNLAAQEILDDLGI